MKAEDIIVQLINTLPTYSDYFSDKLDISSITNSAGIATVVTDDEHGLEVGEAVFLSGVIVGLDIVSIVRSGTILTVTTALDHDVSASIFKTIELSGVAESEFNGTFTLLGVTSSKILKLKVEDSGPASGSTGQVLNVNRFDQTYDGLFKVESIVDLNTFTVSSRSNIESTYNTGKVHKDIRISGSATLERAKASYTAQKVNRAWCMVVLGAANASKSRQSQTDFTDEIQRSDYFRQRFQETVSIFIIVNTKESIGGREIRDDMVDVHRALMKSIAFKKFPSPMSPGESSPLIFNSHGINEYDAGALYVHEFFFECATEMYFDDTVGYDPDVAFRKIDMEQFLDFGATSIDSTIKLGE